MSEKLWPSEEVPHRFKKEVTGGGWWGEERGERGVLKGFVAVVRIELAPGKSRLDGLGWKRQDRRATGVTGVKYMLCFWGITKTAFLLKSWKELGLVDNECQVQIVHIYESRHT